MHWGFLFIWIIGAWLVWALLQDNRICFGSAQLSDEAFEEMPFRGIGIMDDDQRAALVGSPYEAGRRAHRAVFPGSIAGSHPLP